MAETDNDLSYFDDLLSSKPSDDEKKSLTDLQDGGQPAEDPRDKLINELREQLNALQNPVGGDVSVAPVVVPQTQEEKAAEHARAVALNAQERVVPEPVFDETPATPENTLRIHILRDGFTFGGQTWYTGQIVDFPLDGIAYEQNKKWLHLSPEEQIAKWRHQLFGIGDYPFNPNFLDDLDKDPLERKRGTAAPITR